jgi:hypothetical protein
LDSIIRIETSLEITNNDILKDLSGLESLEEIEWLNISSNPSLTSLNGLEMLSDNTLRSLIIDSNPRLKEISEFTAAEYISNVRITSNDSLSSLSGLNNVKSVGLLEIKENKSLPDLKGLDSLSSVVDATWILGNEALTSLTGLNSLEYTASLKIHDNDMLSSINALSNLTELSLEHPVPNIIISDNEILPSLSGIDFINANSIYELIITDNPALSTCEVMSVCNLLSVGGLNEIHDNAHGCNSPEEVEEACSVGVPEQQGDIEFLVYPNPTSGALHLSYTIHETRDLRLELYTLQGVKMQTLMNDCQQAGEYEITFDINNLPSGMYLLVMQSGNERVMKMVIR